MIQVNYSAGHEETGTGFVSGPNSAVTVQSAVKPDSVIVLPFTFAVPLVVVARLSTYPAAGDAWRVTVAPLYAFVPPSAAKPPVIDTVPLLSSLLTAVTEYF